MSVNPFFQNYDYHGEQQVYDDLTVEYIKLGGQDMYYIPYTDVNKDTVYNEDTARKYTKAYLLEFFIRSVDGFEGDGSFVSKFGLEIRDQVTFTVSRRRFMEEVGDELQIPRPRDGDLIYFPLNNKVFQIMFVDDKPFFYPFGKLYTWDLSCENFEYSSEEFSTGIEAIDRIQYSSQNQYDWGILDDEGKVILDEAGMPILMDSYDPDLIDPIDDTPEIQTEADDLIDWSVADPFSENGRY